MNIEPKRSIKYISRQFSFILDGRYSSDNLIRRKMDLAIVPHMSLYIGRPHEFGDKLSVFIFNRDKGRLFPDILNYHILYVFVLDMFCRGCKMTWFQFLRCLANKSNLVLISA